MLCKTEQSRQSIHLSQTADNLSAATSRIKDADFAQETAQLASHQIKQQAAVSMLAQNVIWSGCSFTPTIN